MSGVTDWIQPEFGPIGTVLTVLLVLGAAGLPLLPRSKNFLERLRRARETDSNALVKRYVRSIVVMWVVGGLALAVPAFDPGITRTDVGLGPAGPGFWYVAAYIVLVMLIATPLRIVRQRRLRADGRNRLATRVTAMHPTTARERWLATAISITAGITEEITFRGLFIAAGVGLLHVPAWVAALLSAVVFGIGHRYQGVRGMVGTGVLGVTFAALYLVSGNLLIPIVMHVLIDVLALVIAPMFSRDRRSGHSPPQSAAAPQPADRDPSPESSAVRPSVLRPPH